MRVVAIVQARLGSTRLPHKVLQPIRGRTILHHVLDRVSAIRGVDEIVVAVPNEDYAILGDVVSAYGGVSRFGGSSLDVLDRFAKAAQQTNADVILRVTADCPLLDPYAAEKAIRYITSGCDFATNDTTTTGWPDGTDVEAFTREILDTAHARATTPDEREHVTPWMRAHAQHIGTISLFHHYTTTKISVDTVEDLRRVQRIYAHLALGHLHFEGTAAAAILSGVWSAPA